MDKYVEALSNVFQAETGIEPQQHHIKLFEALYKLELFEQEQGKQEGYYIDKLLKIKEVYNG